VVVHSQESQLSASCILQSTSYKQLSGGKVLRKLTKVRPTQEYRHCILVQVDVLSRTRETQVVASDNLAKTGYSKNAFKASASPRTPWN